MKATKSNTLRKSAKLCFPVIACALICSLFGTGYATGDAVSQRQIKRAIAEVRMGKSSTARTEAAEHVAGLTRRIDPKRVDDTILAELISLLDSPEDSVRAWVAAALGNLGTRAKVAAVPKLLALLPEADCLRGSLTSAPAIRLALARMGETPPRPKCGTAGE